LRRRGGKSPFGDEGFPSLSGRGGSRSGRLGKKGKGKEEKKENSGLL